MLVLAQQGMEERAEEMRGLNKFKIFLFTFKLFTEIKSESDFITSKAVFITSM